MVSLKDLTDFEYPRLPAHKPVIDATLIMRDRNIGAVLVVEGVRVVGIFSERDVMNRVVATCLDPHKVTLAKVMTKELITIPVETRPTVAIELMHRKKIRHLPVTQNNKIVGVVNLRILLSHVIRNLAKINRDLQTELDQLRFFGMRDESIDNAA